MPLSITCPACREPLDVDEEYRAWKVRCPQCRHEFYPDHAAPPPRPPAPPDEADDDPDAPPRPRRRRRRTDAEVVARAKALVAGPASWLRVVGVLGLLLGIIGVIGAVSVGVWVADNPAQAARQMNIPNADELIVNVILIGVCSAFCVVFGGLIAYGAIKMGRLESHGWAMASCILAVASVLFCTCSIFTTIPFGVWGLVVVNKPEVRAGFEIVGRRDRPRRADPDDDRYDD